jgi:hypothetical protein
MLVALVFVQAHAAGKHDISEHKKLVFEIVELRRRVLEIRKLVHAVVYSRHRLQVASEFERHRRVIPGGPPTAHAVAHEFVDETLQVRGDVRVRRSRREARHDHEETVAARAHVEPRADVRLEDRFLDEKNPALLGTPGEQVLGSLKNEIPAKMGEDDEVGDEFG